MSNIDDIEEFLLIRNLDFIHICINWTNHFIDHVTQYVSSYSNKDTITIIHSTVRPFTTRRLMGKFPRIVYSPVRGLHANLIGGLYQYEKVYACKDRETVLAVGELFEMLKMNAKGYVQDPTSLEFAKHFNTEWYFKEIMFVQELFLVATKYKLNLDTIIDFIISTGDRKLLPYAQTVGGSCLVPNAEVFSEFSTLAQFLLTHNKEFQVNFGDKIKRLDGKE